MPYFTFLFWLLANLIFASGQVACHTLLFYFGFLQKLGNTKQQPSVRGASLILALLSFLQALKLSAKQ